MTTVASMTTPNIAVFANMRCLSGLAGACHKSRARIASIMGGSISPNGRILIAKPTPMPHSANAKASSRLNAR